MQLVLHQEMRDHRVQLWAQAEQSPAKKKIFPPAVGSRKRCTAAEYSQDADASKTQNL